MGKRMRHAAAVSNDVKAFVAAFQVLVNLHLHVVELHFHAVQKSIVIGCSRSHFVQGIDHLDNTVQDSLGQYQTEITGRRHKSWAHQPFFNPLHRTSPASYQIAEPLNDHAAAQHIGQSGNTLAVPVAVFERLGKMLGHQKGKVGILCLTFVSLVTVAVYSNDPVGVFIYNDSIGIHAESTHVILKFLRAVHNLALVQFVCKMRKDHCRKLHADADIHSVGFGRNIHIPAHILHPFASASSHRNNTFITFPGRQIAYHTISRLCLFQFSHRRVEVKINMIFHMVVKVLQHHVVDVRTKMADRRVEKIQLVLETELLELRACRGIQLRSRAAVFHIDLVHVFHKINGFLFSDMLVERTSEVIGNIVFSVRKSSRAAETAHDGTASAVDAGLHLIAVNGAFSFFQRIALLEYRHFILRFLLHQLICRENPSRTRADDNHIILHKKPPC